MTEKPILFSAPMVRAILNGSKTQTRRIVKGLALDWLDGFKFTPEYVASPENHMCPYGDVGGQLWVRETFMDLLGTGIEGNTPQSKRYAYAEATPKGSYGDEARKDYCLKWKPSIFMPRAASRIQLEITNVRIELLNDISEKDAQAEGFNSTTYDGWCIDCYNELWESINGTGSWDAKPYVWVIEFKLIKPRPNHSTNP